MKIGSLYLSSKFSLLIPILPSHLHKSQTPILADPHLNPTRPLASNNSRSSNSQFAHRLALTNLDITAISQKTNLNTTDRRTKAAVAFAFLNSIVEDVSLRNCAKDLGCCESVDYAGAGEDAQV